MEWVLEVRERVKTWMMFRCFGLSNQVNVILITGMGNTQEEKVCCVGEIKNWLCFLKAWDIQLKILIRQLI